MPTWTQRLTPRHIIGIAFLGVMWILLSALLGQPKAGDYEGGWDFQAIWLGPHLLARGESPFDAQAWLGEHELYGFAPQNDTFMYPLPFAILLLPIGILPLGMAAVVWIAMTLVFISFSAYLILKPHVNLTTAYVLPVLIGIFLFRPTAVLIYILQLDAIVLVWLVGAWFLWLRERWFLGGIVLALTALKPQVGGPLLAFLGIWLLYRTKWKALTGMAAGLVGLILLGLLFDPGWVGRWLAIGVDKTAQNFHSTPTLWGLTAFVCQPNLKCVQWVGTVLAILLTVGILWIILRRGTAHLTFVIGTVICGTLFISPYLWSYTQILLIFPILMITVALYRLQQPYLLVATFPLITALTSLGLLGISILVGADLISGLLPVLVWVPFFLVDRRDPELLHARSDR